MGQYHMLYNLDKQEFINPHQIGCGLKLCEQLSFKQSTSDALFLLTAVSNGRGGGDMNDHKYIGRWGGDRIAVIGDYHEPDDIPGFDFSELENFKDISEKVHEMLESVLNDKIQRWGTIFLK